MSNSQNRKTSSISFEKAISSTQSLIVKANQNQLSEAEIEQNIAALITTKKSARGFFATYLTSDFYGADHPSEGVIRALKTAPEVVSELLVKNLAMSSAMAVTHHRKNNLEQVKGSEKVCRRTANLIQQLNLPAITTELRALQTAITQNEGHYVEFLNRWQYDAEQKKNIELALSQPCFSL